MSDLRAGTALGHYVIVAPLGAGGMGTVYRARDTRLDRDVALKFLTAAGPGEAARLLAEAKAASALNHPGICTVHEVVDAANRAFIVMELIEGVSLEGLVRPGGLPAEAVTRHGVQIAEALAHAHARGLVHRDLKSANVIVTPEGRLKILDFGLAERLPPDDAQAATRTSRTLAGAGGVLAGTLHYMAPELLRAEPATPRSDVWALGVVLYELAAGRRPFDGPSAVDVTSSIVKDVPPPLPARVPGFVRTVIGRCLEKEPDRRYATAADVRAALEAGGTSDAGLSGGWFRAAAVRHRPAGVVSVIAVLAAAAASWWLRGDGAPRLPRLTNPVQITSALGLEDHAAWSPDGQFVLYSATDDADLYGGDWNLWVAPIDGGAPVNRTPDHAGDDRFPSPSPDGRSVAFWSDRDGGGLFVMSILGGAPVRVSDSVLPIVERHRTAWSPNGAELAFVDHASGAPLLAIVRWPGGDRRTLPMHGDTAGRFDLAWSPDGRFIAYADHVDPNSDVGRLWLLRLEDGASLPITAGATNDRSPTWRADSRGLYFASNRGGPMDVWHLAIATDGTPVAPPERLTTGLEVRSVAASPDGRRIAYSKGRRVANAWRVPIGPEAPTTWADAEQLTFDQAFIEVVEASRDGRQILFSSDRSGSIQLWGGRPGEAGFPRQVTFDAEPSWSPRFSPDGSRIAFYSLLDGHRAIFTMPGGGGARTPHTGGPHMDIDPSWAPDGRTLTFTSDRTGNFDVWTVDLANGRERQVTTHPALEWFPQWSPDGRHLVFRSDREGRSRLWLHDTSAPAGTPPERLTDGVASACAWAPDGRVVYYRGERDLWAVSLDDRTERPVTDFGTRRGNPGTRTLATDGRYLYFTWEEGLGDIWVMDVEWE